jgi:hypothetical protein
MGYHHLLIVSDDALQLNKERRTEVEAAVGKAIFTLCADPELAHLRGPKLERVTSASILNFGGAVSYKGELHHNEHEVLIWTGAVVKRLHELTTTECAELLSRVREVAK